MGKKYVIELCEKPMKNENGDDIWRVKGFNTLVFDQNGLDKLEEYKEPEEHILATGDVCRIPGQYDGDKLLVLSIGTCITVFLQSNGEVWTMINTSFKEKAVYLYHSNTFDKFLKGGFHELD